ncbi:hypothetical protein EGT56_04065 [Arachnia propionica]|nr:hypothetical protein EGT56_04065 [Arachnia propionica]
MNIPRSDTKFLLAKDAVSLDERIYDDGNNHIYLEQCGQGKEQHPHPTDPQRTIPTQKKNGCQDEQNP